MSDVGDIGDDDNVDLEDRISIDVWKESENKIRLGMQFDSKLQVQKAFDYNEGVYRIVMKLLINGKGGNAQTVHYYQQTCTCGKWQLERFPCSHVIAVCSYREDNPLSISDWKIKTDDLKLSVHRGRKRSNRFHNEMDIRHPGEPRKCGLCHQPGHNRKSCPNSQPRFNAM
ncbi:hypothetical protein LXL04_011794 [Taraxacum kok-saghyz]